jgi:CubicO group peptidase (beta-lactamase class C family)
MLQFFRPAFCFAAAGLILALAACASSRPPVRGVADGPIGDRIDLFVGDSLPSFSGQILVARDGRIVLHQAYGLADRDSMRTNTVETVFDIGSITKQFTAAAILALAEEGRLAVTDTLGRFLPDLPAPKSGLTLHALLTHSSGLPQYSGEDYDPLTGESFRAWLDTVSVEFSPGERFQYSNPGYSALGIVVEAVSGRRYEEFLHTRLLEPAGLTGTGYRVPRRESGELAVGYSPAEGRVGSPLDRFWHPDGPSWNLRANGGILSTAVELYHWQQALVSGRVLSAKSVEQLVTGYIDAPRPNRRYGYGWYVNTNEVGRRWTDHTGGNGAFFALLRWYEEPDVVFAITSNAFDANDTRRLLAFLVKAAVDAEVEVPTR